MGKCLPDKVLVFGVGKGSSFVEHHDGRIFQNGTGKHYALLLAAREVCSLRSYHGVQPLWQPLDDFPTLREVYGTVHLLDGRIGIAVAYVLQNGGLEQSGVLKHERHVAHQRCLIHVPNVHTAYSQAAFAHVPEAWNEPCDGCLAASGRSHQRNGLALRYVEVDVAYGIAFRRFVSERHIAQTDVEGCCFLGLGTL